MERKLRLALGIIIAIAVVVSISVLGFKWQSQVAVNQVLQLEKKVADKSLKIRHVDQLKGSYYLTPSGKTSHLYNEMLTWSKTSLNHTNQPNSLIIVRAETQKTGLKGVQKLLIHRLTYAKSLLTYKKQSDEILRDFHIKSDGSVFKLGDLLNHSESRFLEEVAKLSPNLSYKEPDLSAMLHKHQRGTDGLDYKDGKIIADQGKIELPLSHLYDVIDPSYLKGSDLISYQKKEAKEKAKQEAIAAGKVIALTFDDGPRAETTPQILDILAKYNIKATFYVLGSHIAGNEAIVKRAVAEGHEIGNHTWDHPKLSTLNPAQIAQQINSTNQAVKKATGILPKTVRPPYGDTNATVRAAIGLPQILWSVDTLDWQSHNTQAILGNIKVQTKSGAVILMHDIHQSTVDSLTTILDYLLGQGYQFVTISELYGLRN